MRFIVDNDFFSELYPYGFVVEMIVHVTMRADRDAFEAQAAEWCEEQFGPPGIANYPRFRWTRNGPFFGFGYEVDAAAFKIRWG